MQLWSITWPPTKRFIHLQQFPPQPSTRFSQYHVHILTIWSSYWSVSCRKWLPGQNFKQAQLGQHSLEFWNTHFLILASRMSVQFPSSSVKPSSIWLGMNGAFRRNVRSYWEGAIVDGGISKGNCLFGPLATVELIKCSAWTLFLSALPLYKPSCLNRISV